jgi:hypothetical protein
MKGGTIMTPKRNVAVDPAVYERFEALARAEGTTADLLAEDVMKRELARRFFERNRREAALRRGNMTDAEVEAEVDTAVHEWRTEQRSR